MKLDRIPNSSPAAHSFGSFCSFIYSCASSDPGVPKTVRARSDQELLRPKRENELRSLLHGKALWCQKNVFEALTFCIL